jgi:hypothetical protein
MTLGRARADVGDFNLRESAQSADDSFRLLGNVNAVSVVHDGMTTYCRPSTI